MGDGKTTSCPKDGGATADDERQVVAALGPSDVLPGLLGLKADTTDGQKATDFFGFFDLSTF